MRLLRACLVLSAVAWSVAVPFAVGALEAPLCEGFGPQTPRDIDDRAGDNARTFSPAPGPTKLNLCNIHFHRHAEHKARDFSLPGQVGDHGEAGGFRCVASRSLTSAELAAPADNHCGHVGPGDTVEVHWVYSSCDVVPGEGLGACLSDACANPDLRVEAQVFLLVNDDSALDFAQFGYEGNVVNGLHQPRSLPSGTGTPVEFLGSTTGPKFTEQECSPLQVSWSVRPQCAKLGLASLSEWCSDNVFAEDHAHGVRELVTARELLAPIR